MAPSALNWNVIDQLRQGLSVPFVLKGIMTPEEADAAVKHGVQGIVVSDYGGLLSKGMAPAIEVLPSIVDAGRRTGSGSRRWKLSPRLRCLQGAGLRRDCGHVGPAGHVGPGRLRRGRSAIRGGDAADRLGRDFGQCGTPTIKSITRAHVKIHQA